MEESKYKMQKTFNNLKRQADIMLIKNFQKGDLNNLVRKINYMGRNSRAVVKKAYLLAEDAHKFQKRLSGEPYVIHPYNVGLILADLKLDAESLCAGLLHDVLEDTSLPVEYIKKEFGETILDLIRAVTKISVLRKESKEKRAADNIRRMILATIEDPRVILIKLADKIHNMRTLQYHKKEKIKAIAEETLDIYAPLASRLGIFKIKSELEDLCMLHLYPDDYYELKKKVSEKKSYRNARVKAVSSILKEKLKEQKIKASVEGRTKHFYSIFQKMKSKNRSFDEILDLNGMRVLVESVQDCYSALGIVHTIWRPVPGRFKDYIAVPKSNGYQSLHTSVLGKNGKPLEIQIRTRRMHTISQFGIAAHWAYKADNPVEESKQFYLLQNIAAIQMEQGNKNSTEFVRELKESLASSEIYVFTPKGEIVMLPKGSTVLDFAFRIHTELGLRCAGAKVDSRLVSHRALLNTGNQVEVIRSTNVKPTQEWLTILRTSHARSKLKSWLKRKKKPGEFRVAHEGKKNTVSLPHSSEYKNRLTIDFKEISKTLNKSVDEIIVKMAKCCSPTPGFSVIALATKNQIVSIHKKECPAVKNALSAHQTTQRIFPAEWVDSFETFQTDIILHGHDRPQLALDILKVMTFSGVHIVYAIMKTLKNSMVQNTFTIELDSIGQLNTIIESLQEIESIVDLKTSLDNLNSSQKK